VTWDGVRRTADEPLFNSLIEQHHYRGYEQPVGEHLKYLAWGRGRPIASVVLLGLLPVATVVPAVAALGLVAAVCVALIVYEVVRYRESRAYIRSRRGAFTIEEASRIEPTRRRERRPRARHSHTTGGDAQAADRV